MVMKLYTSKVGYLNPVKPYSNRKNVLKMAKFRRLNLLNRNKVELDFLQNDILSMVMKLCCSKIGYRNPVNS